jgi:hypothetical protein
MVVGHFGDRGYRDVRRHVVSARRRLRQEHRGLCRRPGHPRHRRLSGLSGLLAHHLRVQLPLAELDRRLPATARPGLQPSRVELRGDQPAGRLHGVRANLAVPCRLRHHFYRDELRQPAVLHRWPVLRHLTRPRPDFARAVTGLEVQREAGRYLDPNTLEIFKGYDNRCRKKLFGLVNCCKGGGTSGSLFSTMSLISGPAARPSVPSDRATPTTPSSRPTRPTW